MKSRPPRLAVKNWKLPGIGGNPVEGCLVFVQKARAEAGRLLVVPIKGVGKVDLGFG